MASSVAVAYTNIAVSLTRCSEEIEALEEDIDRFYEMLDLNSKKERDEITRAIEKSLKKGLVARLHALAVKEAFHDRFIKLLEEMKPFLSV